MKKITEQSKIEFYEIFCSKRSEQLSKYMCMLLDRYIDHMQFGDNLGKNKV